MNVTLFICKNFDSVLKKNSRFGTLMHTEYSIESLGLCIELHYQVDCI